MIPGRRLHRVAIALCSPDMRERAIDAFLADFQREWLDAVTVRCRVFVLARGYAGFTVTLAGCLVRDAQHDLAGLTVRVLKRIVYPSLMLGVSLGAVFAPSWVKTGHVDWFDAARGLAWMGSFTTALLIARYRSRHADRRALPAFFLALGVAVAILVLHPVNDGRGDVYKWLYNVSLTMAWPFLVRKHPSIVKAPHRD